MIVPPIDVFVDYEITGSWWSKYVGSPSLQRLTGRYFAWKTRRKYERFVRHVLWCGTMEERLR